MFRQARVDSAIFIAQFSKHCEGSICPQLSAPSSSIKRNACVYARSLPWRA